MTGGVSLGTKRLRAVQITAALLLLIVIWSVVKRFVIDMPNLAAGTLPEDEFDHRYVERAWVAYLHIVPGALYLFLAPLQLAYRIRSRHYTFHRRLGRVVATAGMISGVFALIFGGLFSFGGLPEASAAVLFGLWFLTCLVLAVRAIRRDDIVHHRRWMIRAFAIGIGIGTIRIWLALLQIVGVGEASSFGPAFWISFPLHVVAGELWLRAFPNPPSSPTSRRVLPRVHAGLLLANLLGSPNRPDRRSRRSYQQACWSAAQREPKPQSPDCRLSHPERPDRIPDQTIADAFGCLGADIGLVGC
jgi:uncharacterized membrane protein